MESVIAEEAAFLAIYMPDDHQWISLGTMKNARNVPFLLNLPSEGIFTAPHRTGVNGILRSTMPLAYGGTLIENIQLTFAKGRIVDYTAATGFEVLKGIIDTDECSHYLGEVALVPITSPVISRLEMCNPQVS